MITIFYQQVSSIDCSVMTADKGPVGFSYWADLEFQGELGADGVIVDFALAKKQAKNILDNLIDHHFIVARHQGVWKEDGEQLSFQGEFGEKENRQKIFYQAPRRSFLIMPDDVSFSLVDSSIL